MIQRRELFMRCWISMFLLSIASVEQQGRTGLVILKSYIYIFFLHHLVIVSPISLCVS